MPMLELQACNDVALWNGSMEPLREALSAGMLRRIEKELGAKRLCGIYGRPLLVRN